MEIDGADDQTHVMAQWWPAEVSLPGGRGLRNARVYITDDPWLVVFTKPGEPAFRSRVDLSATTTPPSGRSWPPQSVDVVTDDGLVVVVPSGGCGCGNPLKRWAPVWASRTTAWRNDA